MGVDARLKALVARGPSDARWRALCDELGGIADRDVLEQALCVVREPVACWPARLRRAELRLESTAEPVARWLGGVFQAVVDPRLELVGWASMRRRTDYSGADPFDARLATYGGIVRAFARRLEPGFAPSERLRRDESGGTSAYGCGGGWASMAWGDEAQGISYDDRWTEHPSTDESDDSWAAYGLGDGKRVSLQHWDRGGGYLTLEVEGPTPGVLQIALAWGALLREEPPRTLETVHARLEAAHLPWE